jgi:hypothetical protein
MNTNENPAPRVNAESRVDSKPQPWQNSSFKVALEVDAKPPAPAADAVIGVDLGIRCALALFSAADELIKVADMPTQRDGPAGRAAVNTAPLADVRARLHARQIFCEHVATRPKEGAAGAFSFGRCRGVAQARASRLPDFVFEAFAPVESLGGAA